MNRLLRQFLLIIVVLFFVSPLIFAQQKNREQNYQKQKFSIPKPQIVTFHYFDVQSNNPKISNQECRASFHDRNYSYSDNSPILIYGNDVLITNRNFTEHSAEKDFVIGYGTADISLKLNGKTQTTTMIFRSLRLSSSNKSVGVFYNDYCRGFFERSISQAAPAEKHAS